MYGTPIHLKHFMQIVEVSIPMSTVPYGIKFA